MNEVDYYEEFSKKFTLYLNSVLGPDYRVFYGCNRTLDVLVSNLEELSGVEINIIRNYIPKLKVDIVFVIINPQKKARLILIEAKLLSQLGLKDYSQLVGYLQVAKIIELGLLLLIKKGDSSQQLSNDFNEIIRLKKLPMDWVIDMSKYKERHMFKTGIIYYQPGNGISWENTKDLNGISSLHEFSELIKI
jgi:hypothetical protein